MGALRGSATLTVCCLMAGIPAGCLAAADAGGSLALTRDDIYRGLSQTCGHPAAQADLHVRELGASSWAAFLGAWGSAGLGRAAPCGSARELNLYAGYSIALTPQVRSTLTYTRYVYPGGGYGNPHLWGQRYDYDQLATLWVFAERLYLSFAWTPDALRYERYEDSFRIEQDRNAFAYGLEWRQPLASWASLTAGAGYDRMADPFGTGYGFWSVGLSHVTGPLELQVTYFRTAGRAVRLFGRGVAGARVSATLIWRLQTVRP